MTVVDIGVACSGHQTADWWGPVMSLLLLQDRRDDIEIGHIYAMGSALPDHNKNNTIQDWSKRRNSLTDANRVGVSNRFLEGTADYLFSIDDDTVPPFGIINALLTKGRDFIGGLYFLPGEPHNPIAYYRQPDNLYFPVWNYPEGALLQVDAIGMGCTLIHRSVFEKIIDQHEVFMRLDGSQLPVHKSLIHNRKQPKHPPKKPWIKDGIYHMPVVPKREDDNRGFPFFALEYGRTEDFHFCELANNVGSKPWLDTTQVCNHFKPKPTGRAEYKESLGKAVEVDESP